MVLRRPLEFKDAVLRMSLARRSSRFSPLELRDLFGLGRRDSGPVALVDLDLLDPVAQRLGIDPQLLADPTQGTASSGRVTPPIDRHPERSLPKLLGISSVLP